jgi:uncharacterized protein (TIGR00251 family)
MAEIPIRVKPRSSRQAILGLKDGVLQVALNSPPEGGKANRELLKVLGKHLGIPPSSLEIVSGHKSRDKRVSIPRLSEEEFERLFTPISRVE